MELKIFEFLKAISEVLEASNEKIFKICARVDLNLHLAPKKFENRKCRPIYQCAQHIFFCIKTAFSN